MNKTILLIIGILVVLLLCGAGYRWYWWQYEEECYEREVVYYNETSERCYCYTYPCLERYQACHNYTWETFRYGNCTKYHLVRIVH